MGGIPFTAHRIYSANADPCSHCAPGRRRPPSSCLGRCSRPGFGPLGQFDIPHSASHSAGGEGRQRGVRATPRPNDETRGVLGAVQVLVIGLAGACMSSLIRHPDGLDIISRSGRGLDRGIGRGLAWDWHGIGKTIGKELAAR